jgi:hypothetical protein
MVIAEHLEQSDLMRDRMRSSSRSTMTDARLIAASHGCTVVVMAHWTKGDICEGGVLGGERIHGYTPDGNLLCGATGEDGTDSYPFDGRCNHPEDPEDFHPDERNACKRCSASYRRLSD